jgi:hypothetical protein
MHHGVVTPDERPSEPAAEATAPDDAEELLDLAIELTFPASDPVSIVQAFVKASARQSQT